MKSSSPTLVANLAAFQLFAQIAAGVALNRDRPNIILVLIDDMGWDDFSCFGN